MVDEKSWRVKSSDLVTLTYPESEVLERNVSCDKDYYMFKYYGNSKGINSNCVSELTHKHLISVIKLMANNVYQANYFD